MTTPRVAPASPSRPAAFLPTLGIAVPTVVAIGGLAAVVTVGHHSTGAGAGLFWVVLAWVAAVCWTVGLGLAGWAAYTGPSGCPLDRIATAIALFGGLALLGVSLLAAEWPIAPAWIWLWALAWAGDRTGRAGTPVSPVRWSAALALVVALVVGSSSQSAGLAISVVLVVALLGVAEAFAWAIRSALASYQRELERRHRERIEREQRRRANWLHDDVLSELQLARLRLETAGGDHRRILAELGDVEHRLRLRQLDAELESGRARLAEVIQPYVRMVTRAQVTVGGVPSAEVCRRWVDSTTGYELQRFLGVAVPNALLAGATVVTFELDWRPDRLVARVRDDAGGFEVADVHPGRGRDRLAAELGAHRLDTQVADGWTCFTCEFTIPLSSP